MRQLCVEAQRLGLRRTWTWVDSGEARLGPVGNRGTALACYPDSWRPYDAKFLENAAECGSRRRGAP
jgi:hypothetical protein